MWYWCGTFLHRSNKKWKNTKMKNTLIWLVDVKYQVWNKILLEKWVVCMSHATAKWLVKYLKSRRKRKLNFYGLLLRFSAFPRCECNWLTLTHPFEPIRELISPPISGEYSTKERFFRENRKKSENEFSSAIEPKLDSVYKTNYDNSKLMTHKNYLLLWVIFMNILEHRPNQSRECC